MPNKNTTRLLELLSAIAAASALLTACGGGTDSTRQPTSSTTPGPATSATPKPTTAATPQPTSTPKPTATPKPTVTAVPQPTSGTGNASDCYNPDLQKNGTTFTWKWASGNVTFTNEANISTNATFNGKTGLTKAVRKVTLQRGAISTVTNVTDYNKVLKMVNNAPVIEDHGSVSQLQGAFASSTDIHTPPTPYKHLSLKKGESYVRTETIKSQFGSTPATTTTTKTTVTYIGQEKKPWVWAHSTRVNSPKKKRTASSTPFG